MLMIFYYFTEYSFVFMEKDSKKRQFLMKIKRLHDIMILIKKGAVTYETTCCYFAKF